MILRLTLSCFVRSDDIFWFFSILLKLLIPFHKLENKPNLMQLTHGAHSRSPYIWLVNYVINKKAKISQGP